MGWSKSPSAKTCSWIIGESNTRCNEVSVYRYTIDDDGNKVREYAGLCEEHSARLKGLAQNDDEY